MLSWLWANSGTILVCAIVLLLAGGAAFSLLRNKRKGKSGCGCGCASCSMCGACHAAKKEQPKGAAHTRS